MTRYLLTALIVNLCLGSAAGQDFIRYFTLTPPKNHKINGSLYRHLEFMDSRPDTTLIGLVQIGGFNNIDARLILKTPIQPQFQRVLDSLIDPAAKDGALLLQLRDMSFVETLHTRYLFVKATLYTLTPGGYRKLSTLDVTDLLEGYDVTTQVNTSVNDQLVNFISAALTVQPADSTGYTLTDLRHMDSIEEQRIPLYTAVSFTDGLYLNYTSFSRQVPDRQGMVKARRDGSISSVHDTGTNKIKLKPKDLYAVVYKGKAFIATRYGYYPLQRIRNNLFFTGDIHIRPSSSYVASLVLFVGVGTALNAAAGFEETYDLLIDPLTGQFIHLRRIEKPQTP